MMTNSLIGNISKDIQKLGYRELNSELICKDKIQNYGQNSKWFDFLLKISLQFPTFYRGRMYQCFLPFYWP